MKLSAPQKVALDLLIEFTKNNPETSDEWGNTSGFTNSAGLCGSNRYTNTLDSLVKKGLAIHHSRVAVYRAVL